jgi:hypothetical protein
MRWVDGDEPLAHTQGRFRLEEVGVLVREDSKREAALWTKETQSQWTVRLQP